MIIKSPLIWAGLLLYGVATLIWFKLLSSVQFSVLYPLQSIAYIVAMIAAWYFFDENISWTKIIGALIILIGVYIISK
nr:EamA family transporter [Cohnella sp. REN36]